MEYFFSHGASSTASVATASAFKYAASSTASVAKAFKDAADWIPLLALLYGSGTNRDKYYKEEAHGRRHKEEPDASNEYNGFYENSS